MQSLVVHIRQYNEYWCTLVFAKTSGEISRAMDFRIVDSDSPTNWRVVRQLRHNPFVYYLFFLSVLGIILQRIWTKGLKLIIWIMGKKTRINLVNFVCRKHIYLKVIFFFFFTWWALYDVAESSVCCCLINLFCHKKAFFSFSQTVSTEEKVEREWFGSGWVNKSWHLI